MDQRLRCLGSPAGLNTVVKLLCAAACILVSDGILKSGAEGGSSLLDVYLGNQGCEALPLALAEEGEVFYQI